VPLPRGTGIAGAVDTDGTPVAVPNDNHVNPGYSYYFLRDPAQPFDAVTNPYTGSLGTPEGADPNTLRTPPQMLVSLHLETDVSRRATLRARGSRTGLGSRVAPRAGLDW